MKSALPSTVGIVTTLLIIIVLSRVIGKYDLSSWISSFFDSYMLSLENRPVLTKSTTTAFIQFCGDYFAQSYEIFQFSQREQQRFQLRNVVWIPKYDIRRGLSMAADGMLLSGPLLHYAFEAMEAVFPTETEDAKTDWLSAATALHVIANDYIVDSVYLFFSFFFVAIAEGHIQDLPKLFRKDFLATLKASWVTSVALMPIEYLCFSGLPFSLRVLSMNFVDLLWGAVISFVAHRGRKHDDTETTKSD